MNDRVSQRTGWVAAAALMLAGLVLAACATNPAGSSPAPAGTGAPVTASTQAATGRLKVVVTDQNGRPLDGATVNVRAVSGSFFRATGATDRGGEVTFLAVPLQVEVSVVHQTGSYSQVVTVPQTGGTMEARMMITTFGSGTQDDSGVGGA